MSRYSEAKEIYAKWGIDTDKAIKSAKIPYAALPKYRILTP